MKIHQYIFIQELVRSKDLLTLEELEIVKDSFVDSILKTLYQSKDGSIHLDEIIEVHEKLIGKIIAKRDKK